jgi:glycosyltransferase involved in cell wall biosynthesis
MNNIRDIVMVLPHFGPGGSQRVASVLLREWGRRGLNCTLVTTYDHPEDAHVLAPGIERRVLFSRGKTGSSGSGRRQRRERIKQVLGKYLTCVTQFILRAFFTIKWAIKLRRELNSLRPKVIISFLPITNIMVLVARVGKEWPLIISERNDPALQPLPFPFNVIRRLMYKHANYVTANTMGAIEHMRDYVPHTKLKYVPNPLENLPDAYSGSREKVVLFVGRLVQQKCVDVLISAFASSRLAMDGWRLDILGDGPERLKLEGLVQKLGIQDHAVFYGHRGDADVFFKRSSLLVLPSLYEGMPNVLLEAMMFSMPFIVSDASSGPVELAGNNAGVVVPAGNPDALALALRKFAENPEKIVEMGRAGRHKVDAFNVTNVLAVWDEIFSSMAVSLNK